MQFPAITTRWDPLRHLLITSLFEGEVSLPEGESLGMVCHLGKKLESASKKKEEEKGRSLPPASLVSLTATISQQAGGWCQAHTSRSHQDACPDCCAAAVACISW